MSEFGTKGEKKVKFAVDNKRADENVPHDKILFDFDNENADFSTKNLENGDVTQQKQKNQSTIEIEDLRNRLKIAIAANNDYKKLSEQNKREMQEHFELEKQAIDSKNKENIKNLENKLNGEKLKNKSLQDKLNAIKASNIKQESLVSKLLRQESTLYNNNFDSIESLLAFLSSQEHSQSSEFVDEEKSSLILKNSEKERTIDSLVCTIMTLKNELAAEKNKTMNAERTYKNATSILEQKYQNEISSLRSKLNEKEIDEIDQKNDSVQLPDILKFRSASAQTDSSEDNEVVWKDFDDVSNIDEKETQSAKEAQEYKDLEEECRKYKEEAENYERKLQEQANELMRKDGEILRLNEENKNNETQLKTLSNENNKMKTEIRNLNNQINRLQRELSVSNDANNRIREEMNDTREEIEELYSERIKIVEAYSKQNKLIDMYEAIANSNLRQFKLTSDVKEKVIVERVKEPLVFDLSLLPNELSSVLSAIINNEAIDDNAKIKSLLTVIGRWIRAIEKSAVKATNELKQIIEENNKKEENELDAMRSATKDDNMTLDKLLELVIKLQERAQCSDDQCSKYQGIMNNLICRYNARSIEELVVMINKTACERDDAIEEINKQNEFIKKQKKENKKKFRMIREIINGKDEQVTILEESNNKYKRKIKELNDNVNDLQERLKEAIQKTNDVKEMSNSYLSDAQCKYNEELQEQSTKYSEIIEKLQQNVNDLTAEKNELSVQLKVAVSSKTTAEKMHKEKSKDFSDLLEKYNSLNSIVQKSESELRSSYDQKLLEARRSSEQIINELHQKEAANQNEIAALHRELDESRLELQRQELCINELSSNLRREQYNKKLADESSERSIKLLRAQTNARIAALSADMKTKIDDINNCHEKHLRSLFMYFASNFNAFVDASKQIDESSFKELVLAIRRELEKSQTKVKATRNYLCNGSHESTGDVLTKFIIENHPKLRDDE